MTSWPQGVPGPGEVLLDHVSVAEQNGFPGFTPAVNNAYKVTVKVADYLLARPGALR
jgi:hypothetical protein